MRFFDYIRTAFKNLRRQRSRTFLTVFAIMVGAISVTIMLSLVLGARMVFFRQLESMGALNMITVNNNPDAENNDNLFNPNSNFDSNAKKLTDATVQSLKNLDHVTEATPMVQIWVESIQLEGANKKSQQGVMGYDVNTHVFNIPLVVGRNLRDSDMDKIIIGPRLLRRYGYGANPKDILGKKIMLNMKGNAYNDWTGDPPIPPQNAGDEYWKNMGNQTKAIPAEIIGVTNDQNNDATNYINIAWARKLMTSRNWEYDKSKEEQMKNSGVAYEGNSPQMMTIVRRDNLAEQGYGSIMLKVDDTKNVEDVAKLIIKQGFGAITAKAMIDGMTKMFSGLAIILGAIGGIALFVAAIGIINTMVMAIYERTREIGVMRACGATRSTIRRLFTFEAALLGFFGGVIGLIVSYGLAKIGNYVANHFATTLSIPINNIISFPLWLILGVIGFTTFIGLLAGLYPAIRAARMNPVDALRYE